MTFSAWWTLPDPIDLAKLLISSDLPPPTATSEQCGQRSVPYNSEALTAVRNPYKHGFPLLCNTLHWPHCYKGLCYCPVKLHAQECPQNQTNIVNLTSMWLTRYYMFQSLTAYNGVPQFLVPKTHNRWQSCISKFPMSWCNMRSPRPWCSFALCFLH